MNQQHNFAAQFEGKISRFQCVPSFEALEQALRTAFSLDVPFTVKFVDNENDLCVISSQLELDTAVSLSTEVQLVLLTKSEPIPVTVAKKESLEDEAVVLGAPSTADNKLQKLQSRLQFVQNSLAQPNLNEQKRQKLTQRKAKIETLLENYQVRGVRKSRRGRGNDKLKEIDEALAKPNLSVKQVQRLNRKRSRIQNSGVNKAERRTAAFRLMEIQAALDNPHMPPKTAEKLAQRKTKIEERMVQQKTRLNKQDVRRGAQLEKVRKTLAQPNIPDRRRLRLKEKEGKISSHFTKQEEEMENALDGLSLS
jgi:hypothetical protein